MSSILNLIIRLALIKTSKSILNIYNSFAFFGGIDFCVGENYEKEENKNWFKKKGKDGRSILFRR